MTEKHQQCGQVGAAARHASHKGLKAVQPRVSVEPTETATREADEAMRALTALFCDLRSQCAGACGPADGPGDQISARRPFRLRRPARRESSAVP